MQLRPGLTKKRGPPMHIASLLVVAASAQTLSLLLTLLAARLLSVVAFEAYAVAAAIFILLTAIAPLGGGKHALAFLPRGFDAGAASLLRFGFRRTILTSLAFSFLLASWALLYRPETELRHAMLATCAFIPAGALCHYLVDVLTASDRPLLSFILFRLSAPAVALATIVSMVAAKAPLVAASIICAWGAGWMVSLATFLFVLRQRLRDAWHASLSKREARQWIAQCHPLVIYGAVRSLVAQSPLLALNALGASAVEIGAYAAAAATAGVITLMATATNRLYGRELGLLIGSNSGVEVKRLLHSRFRWLSPAAVILLGFVSLFAERLLAQFRPEFSHVGAWPLRILALANAITVLLALAPSHVKLSGRTVVTYRLMLAALGVQLMLLSYLVPALAATGAAIAYLVAICLMYLSFARISNQELNARQGR